MPADSIVSFETAVTLTGTFCLSSGSFWAVTVTVGMRKRSGSCDEAGGWALASSGVSIAARARTFMMRATREKDVVGAKSMSAIMQMSGLAAKAPQSRGELSIVTLGSVPESRWQS
jgi:hypothetical protein